MTTVCQNSPAQRIVKQQRLPHDKLTLVNLLDSYGNYFESNRWRCVCIVSGLRMKCYGRCIRFNVLNKISMPTVVAVYHLILNLKSTFSE